MPYIPWLKPDGSARAFGVEMEITRHAQNGDLLSGETIKAHMRNARVPRLNRRAPGYYHSSGDTWDVKTDSSCGYEVASPKMELDAHGNCQQLERACMALQSARAVVNRSTGLHVHVDVSDFTWQDFQRLIALWSRYEPFFFEMTPPSRRNNGYCHPLRASMWSQVNTPSARQRWTTTEQALRATNQTMFHAALVSFPRGALNVAHFIRNGRIEFRLQGGSIDYLRIRNWVIMILAVVNRAKTPLAPPVSLTINQPRPELGFGTRHVFAVLGLAPSRWAPDVAPICASLEAWATERRAVYRGTDMSLTF